MSDDWIVGSARLGITLHRRELAADRHWRCTVRSCPRPGSRTRHGSGAEPTPGALFSYSSQQL